MTHIGYPPMLLDERPFEPDRQGWLYEIKFDGCRLIAYVGEKVVLRTKSGADATGWFPELTAALETLPKGRYVFDGEVCALDGLGGIDFDLLQKRIARRRWYPGAAKVVYCIFDLLVEAGVDVTQQPLSARKAALANLFKEGMAGILIVRGFEGEGQDPWVSADAIRPLRLERIVAKRLDSVYQPGVRCQDWVTVKRQKA